MAARKNQRQGHRQEPPAYRGQSYVTYGNVAYELQPDYSPYYKEDEEKAAEKESARAAWMELRENRILSLKSVLVIMILFVGCIAFVSMNVIVANANLQLRNEKTKLADLKATNAILSAEMTEQLDMDFIKAEATTRLGMAEPQPYQVRYIDVPKQSYTIQYAADAVQEKESVFSKISKLIKKD